MHMHTDVHAHARADADTDARAHAHAHARMQQVSDHTSLGVLCVEVSCKQNNPVRVELTVLYTASIILIRS